MLGDDIVRDPRHDELDRAGFTKALAKAILTMDVESPFVFGIEGEWGSGKSTVLEFTKYFLKHRTELGSNVPLETDPIIVELSPWWFSGSEDLLRHFVAEISLQIRGHRKLNSVLRALPDHLDSLDAALTPLAVMPVAAKSKGVVKALSTIIRLLTPRKDVASVRRSIEQTLRSQSDRIVVFLDDLDRLQPHEVLQVFQVVKSIADLPRLIYVLSFDHVAVTAALKEAKVHDPEQYLEKIVQSVWVLPQPDSLGVARMTGNTIDAVLAETPPELWQSDRWRDLYFEGLRELIRTPRDVKRLANALRPTYPPVRGEVNAVDFIGFHALRVLVPNAYSFIISNRGWLTNAEIQFFRDENDERQAHNRQIDELLGTIEVWQRGPVAKMLETIFPMAERHNRRSGVSDSLYSRWQRECRLCSPERFDFYERLSIPTGAVSTGELSRILKPHSVEAFRTEFRRLAEEQAYDGETKLKKFLEYATGGVIGTLEGKQKTELMNYVFQVADEFVSKLEPVSLPFRSFDFQFVALVNAIIGLIPKGRERMTSLVESWANSLALSLMVKCFYSWSELLSHYEAGNLSTAIFFNREELELVKRALLDRLAGFPTAGIAKAPLLDWVIHFWDEHGSGAGSRFAAEIALTEEGLADLAVGALLPRPFLVADPIYRSSADSLERWAGVPRAKLAQLFDDLLKSPRDWSSEIQNVALAAYIREVRDPRDEWGRPLRPNSDDSYIGGPPG